MNFTCPHCFQPTTLTEPNIAQGWIELNLDESIIFNKKEIEKNGFHYRAVRCPNLKCKKLTFKIDIGELDYRGGYVIDTMFFQGQLLPESNAKILENYIPDAIRLDYEEACKIKTLSPKASATLSRRCIQGMIRNFWSISKNTLHLEILELEGKINEDTWEAIDAVRKVGNIGAHMEKDINVIIDVDENEAELLISLIEQLIEDWYVQKHKRSERAKKIIDLAINKNKGKIPKS